MKERIYLKNLIKRLQLIYENSTLGDIPIIQNEIKKLLIKK